MPYPEVILSRSFVLARVEQSLNLLFTVEHKIRVPSAARRELNCHKSEFPEQFCEGVRRHVVRQTANEYLRRVGGRGMETGFESSLPQD